MSASDITAMTEMEIWNRIIRPEQGDLSMEEASVWLRLKFAQTDVERVETLSTKANAGKLTPSEDAELDHYLNVGQALDFFKAKARLSLKNRNR